MITVGSEGEKMVEDDSSIRLIAHYGGSSALGLAEVGRLPRSQKEPGESATSHRHLLMPSLRAPFQQKASTEPALP